MSFQKCLLGDVLTLKRGYDLPGYARSAGDIPVISSSGITGTHNKAKVHGPGVVTGRYGTLGDVFYIKNDFWPLNTALYVKEFHDNDPHFIYYFLRWILKNIQSDKAAVPGVNRNDLHVREIIIPTTIQEQRHIASILSAYDDLIENNRRRMRLLEESARRLYKEWFVHLHFPGHEHCKIVDGVPEGWEGKTLGDICYDVRNSVSPDKISFDTPYIGLEHMPRRSISLSEWGFASDVNSTKLSFTEGDFLFGKIRPYFHKVGIAFVNGITSSDSIVFRPYEESLYALTIMTISSDIFIATTSQQVKEGSKMPRADWKQMKKFQVLLPKSDILSKFNEYTSPIFSQLRLLCFENKNLAAARDLLLPRLMSGEVVV